jgi:hypothetical protein
MEMSFNQQDKREKAYKMRRSLADAVMGLLYSGVGTYLLFVKGEDGESFLPGEMLYVFVGICYLYGAFRIYRAIKQDYYIDKDR